MLFQIPYSNLKCLLNFTLHANECILAFRMHIVTEFFRSTLTNFSNQTQPLLQAGAGNLTIVHLYFRDETFRKQYGRVTELRAILSHTPMLAVTATATQEMVEKIAGLMGIHSFEFVCKVPDRYVYEDLKYWA